MFTRIEFPSSVQKVGYFRLVDWWPAAFVGLVALLSSLPDANAETLLGSATPPPYAPVPAEGLQHTSLAPGLELVGGSRSARSANDFVMLP